METDHREEHDVAPARTVECVQIEANVDDLDPRNWPVVIDRLLAAGAHDAWVTPIVMKKGRPATTLSVLCAAGDADAIRSSVFTHTSTIGLRETSITKHELARSSTSVEVDGHRIGVKVAFDEAGDVVNRSVEWSDVVTAAEALGRPVDEIRARAEACAWSKRST